MTSPSPEEPSSTTFGSASSSIESNAGIAPQDSVSPSARQPSEDIEATLADLGPDTENADAPKLPLAELWNIAWPTVLTMTSFTIMQFVDGWMVSLVGPLEFTAQGNGGIYSFVPIAFAMGMLSVVNTFVSQNLGAGHPERAPRYAWNAIAVAVMFWLIIMIPFGVALPSIFEAIHHTESAANVFIGDAIGGRAPIGLAASAIAATAHHLEQATLITLEGEYGRILVFGSVLVLSSRALNHFFYGMHRPRVVFVSTVIGNAANIAANYVLIFGALGFPELGLHGAAIGTVFGTAVELIIPFCVFLGPKMNRELHTRRAWVPDRMTIRDLVRLGWPRGVTFANELLCWSIFMVLLVGRFGTDHMTAGWIALKYMHLSFMPAVGISVAVTAVVGKYIGAGQPDTANHRAYLGVKLAVGYMGFCALCFVVFREPLVQLFVNTDDPKVAASILSIGMNVLICAAVFQVFDALAIAFSGALTGAGDTLVPGLANVVTSWMFTIGLGAVLAFVVPQLESIGPWIGAAMFIISLGTLLFIRWQAGGWRKIKLVDHDKGTSTAVASGE